MGSARKNTAGTSSAEALRKAAATGHQAPGDDSGGDQIAPVEAIGGKSRRNTEDGVKTSECEALQQPDLGIAQMQIVFQRRHEERKYQAIDERERVADHQHEHRIPGRAAARIIRSRCGRLTHWGIIGTSRYESKPAPVCRTCSPRLTLSSCRK
jgi:hypothetical protein